MNIQKPILKAVRDKRLNLSELAQETGLSMNKLLDGLTGDRLLAPEKITKLGRKVKMKEKDIEKLHKIHNKKNFEKREKQKSKKPKKTKPGRTETDDTPIVR
jgi:cyanate lyase